MFFARENHFYWFLNKLRIMEDTVFDTLEKIIGIPFVADESQNTSVCFACAEEVRSDFKIQFTNADILNYVYGVVLQLHPNGSIKPDLIIPFPLSAADFWNYSNIGKKYRQKQIIKVIEFVAVDQLNWEMR